MIISLILSPTEPSIKILDRALLFFCLYISVLWADQNMMIKLKNCLHI